MKKWMDFIDWGPFPLLNRTKIIPVKQLGIRKIVIVRTKGNGGIQNGN